MLGSGPPRSCAETSTDGPSGRRPDHGPIGLIRRRRLAAPWSGPTPSRQWRTGESESHRAIGLTWGRLHYVLGVPAAILATTAGAAAWNSTTHSNVPAVLALLAGALSAATAFFKCERSRDRNNALCAGWTELADCVRMTLLHYSMDERNPLGVEHARYAESLICLNRVKADLLG